jgi:hypothetical protein
MLGLMRGGLILIGVFVVATALASIGKSISYGMAVQGSSFTTALVGGALGGALIAAIPGLFLIVRARQLASRVFPEPPADPEFDLATLFTGLSALLGVFLIVVGIADLIAGSVLAVSVAASVPELAVEPGREAVSAVVRLGAGGLLFFKAEAFGNVLSGGQ